MPLTRERRDDQHADFPSPHDQTLQGGETLRSAGVSAVPTDGATKKEEQLSTFWRLFGGTLLSIAALVCITLYQQLSSSIAELRSDINRLNEGYAAFVKNDDLNTRLTSLWGGIKELKAESVRVSTLSEKSATLEQQVKAAEEERKELLRQVQQLRERQAALEARASGDKK
jgi:hypothetical protein